MLDCTLDPALWQEAWAGKELPYNYPLDLAELDEYAMAETVPNSLVKALPVLGLFWDMYGAFDRCPQLQAMPSP